MLQVGYGEEAETTLRRARQGRQERQGRQGAGQGAGQQVTRWVASLQGAAGGHPAVCRLRVSEDRASVTTSIDSYPFSPSSPWAQALPSRYNRYGYPVFPQKPFGLPSPTGGQGSYLYNAVASSDIVHSTDSNLLRSGVIRWFLLAVLPADLLQPRPGLHGPGVSPPAQTVGRVTA